MKLVRLDAEASGSHKDKFRLEVHPKMTVVLGASGRVRETLIDAIAGIPRGVAAAGGVIEVGGVQKALNAESLNRLGLSTDLDVVVRADDLPGHDPADDLVAARRQAEVARDSARRAIDGAEAALTEARQAQDEATARLAQVRAGAEDDASAASAAAAATAAERAEAVARLESATAGRNRLDRELQRLRTEREAAAAARAEAQRVMADASSPATPPEPERSDIDVRRGALQRRLAALQPQDPAPVRACLDRIEQRSAEPAPIPAALAFADAWRDLHRQLAGLERAGTGEERLARSRLEAARRAAVEAERELRVSALAPESVAELEAAHRAVLEAQERTNSRFSGGRARARLDELRAVERLALDRLGFDTYADYMMSASSRGVGAGKRAVLQNARLRVAEAEAQWEAAGGDPAREAWRADLLDQRAAIAPRIALLLGHEPEGADVEHELRALRAVPPPDDADIAELRSALSRVGLHVDDDQLGLSDLRELARAWLDEVARLDERRAHLEAELQSLDAGAGAGAGAAGAGTHAARAPGRPVPDGGISLEQAQRDLAAAERQLMDIDGSVGAAEEDLARLAEQETAARAHVASFDTSPGGPEDRQRSLLAETEAQAARASDAVAQAEAEVARRRHELTAAEEQLAAATEAEEGARARAAAPDDRDEVIEEIEWYLLARLAAQRAVGEAGSLPLVLDDTFRDLEVAEAVRVMESMERMSGAVQVIAVSNDRALSFWAEALGEERAGVVSLDG